ncbi:MAG: c-type cytochrome, partial [candidate division NC10 bacterium]|nr:c-type cytochrome [candidate division NC10 bacterium]
AGGQGCGQELFSREGVMNVPKVLRVGAVCLIVLVLAVARSVSAQSGDPNAGKAAYQQLCVECHGTSGKGDGRVAFGMFPKPRNLTTGLFKIRSTLTLPTDQDLFQTISQGIPGTAMPSWANLSEATRRDLVAFVKTLSPEFQQAGETVAQALPATPSQMPELRSLGKFFAQGKQLFQDAGCVKCHGATGRGDGPKAKTLKDDWGYRTIPPQPFSIARLKRGRSVEDIHEILFNGMGGTPMPSFTDSLSDEEIWEVAFYVWTIAR